MEGRFEPGGACEMWGFGVGAGVKRVGELVGLECQISGERGGAVGLARVRRVKENRKKNGKKEKY